MGLSIRVLVHLFGGLGIFFLGLQLMSDGLQKAAGERMRRILEMFTSKPLKAVLTGAGVTAVLQSSSTVTVMVVVLSTPASWTFKLSARSWGLISVPQLRRRLSP